MPPLQPSHSPSLEPRRVGMIVPSSNVTMERELPRFFAEQTWATGEPFSFHSSRVRLRNVSPEELLAMNCQATRAAEELADAEVAVVLYACLVAVMVEGPGAHATHEARLREAMLKAGLDAPVVSSAGALVRTLHEMGARRIGLLAPYLPPLTQKVSTYLEAEGITVVDSRSRGVANNTAVGRLETDPLVQMAQDLRGSLDAIVLSACVQMPSADQIERAERLLGIPVISAATATAYQGLRAMGLRPAIQGYGKLLTPTAPSFTSLDKPASMELHA